jgi:hypothetical protein
MTDKIERARLKKQQEREAEEKEEAERKERLAKRLAAMGPPKAKEQAPPQHNERSPRKDRAVPATVQSPPKPPVPTNDGDVAQYGMMKVHHAQPVKKPPPAEVSKAPSSAEAVPAPSLANAQAKSQTRPSPAVSQQALLLQDLGRKVRKLAGNLHHCNLDLGHHRFGDRRRRESVLSATAHLVLATIAANLAPLSNSFPRNHSRPRHLPSI